MWSSKKIENNKLKVYTWKVGGLIMEEFNSIEKVKELFAKEKCEGKENIYFIAYKDGISLWCSNN